MTPELKMPIAGAIKEWVKNKEWDEEVDCDLIKMESRLSSYMTIHDSSFSLFVESREGKDLLSIYLYPPLSVIESRRAAILSLLNEINNSLRLGRVAMNDRGRIQFHVSVDVESIMPTSKLIDNHVSYLVSAAEKWFPTIAVFIFTDKPLKDVIELAGQDNAETSPSRNASIIQQSEKALMH